MPSDLTARRVTSCTRVNHENIKFGIAEDLDRRSKNYAATFPNCHNFHQILILPTEKHRRVERAIKAKLKKNILGGTKEWLVGVTFDQVKAIMIEVAKSLNEN